MNHIIATIIFTFSMAIYTAYGQPGSCHMRELDLCTATLLVLTQNPQGLSGTDQEIERQCGYIRESENCRHNYTTRCLTSLQKELIDFAFQGGKSVSTEFCTVGSEMRANYKKHAKCISDARAESKPCTKDLQRALEEVNRVAITDRVAMACCAYNRFEGCSGRAVKQRCGPDALELSRKIVRMASARLPEIVCQAHPATSDKCTSLLPAEGTEPLGAQSNSVLSRIFSSYTGN